MHTIMLSLQAADLAEAMAAMRCWLDEHRVQPATFTYKEADKGNLAIKLAFALGAEAEVFAAAFGSRQASDPIPPRQAAPAAPPPLSRLMHVSSRARRRQRLELRQQPKARRIFEGHSAVIHRNQSLAFQLVQHPVDMRRAQPQQIAEDFLR